MSSKLKASRSLTLLCVWMQIFYLFGTLPKITFFVITFVLNIHTPLIDLLYVASNLIAVIMRGSNIIAYYYFNKLYRKILQEYFQTIINCFECKFTFRKT